MKKVNKEKIEKLLAEKSPLLMNIPFLNKNEVQIGGQIHEQK